MILKRGLLFIICLTCIVCISHAQDPHFSQYYASPLYLNPGFTGSTPQQRATVNHRIQWPNLPQAFSTYSASYEFFHENMRSGFGILASTDKMGSAGWRTTFAGLAYSYKIQVMKNWIISPGLYFAYGSNGLDRSKLTLRDGLAYNNISIDPELDRLGKASFFDVSAGVVMYNKNSWIGISSFHMNRPNISILGDESRLPSRVAIHGGMTIPLYNGIRKKENVHYLSPSFIYKMQGPSFQQLDIGVRYHIDPLAFGLWYRGIPVKGSAKSETEIVPVVQQDAIVFITNLLVGDFQFGYSLDFTISELQTSTGGAHEFSVIYEFVLRDIRRTKRKDKILPCPSFIRSGNFH